MFILFFCLGTTVLTMVVIATAWKKKSTVRSLTCHRMYLTPYFSNDDDVRPVLDHLMLYQRDAPIWKVAGGRTRKPTHHQRESPAPRGENWSESVICDDERKRNHVMQTQRGGGEESSVSKIKKVNSRHEKIIKCRRTRGFGCRTPPSFLFFF